MTANHSDRSREASGEPRPGLPSGPSVAEAAQAASEAMLALIDAAARASTGKRRDPHELGDLVLAWRPDLSAKELAQSAVQMVSEALSDTHVFETGRLYCYACGSADCPHARPPHPGDVFTGYESTGRPRWQEFFRFLLSLEDDRTERLFADRPELLARVIGRGRVISDQLASFGRHSYTYRIWGQVVAGYLSIRDVRAAVTMQFVEDKRHHLNLQVVAAPMLHEALANAPDDRRSAFHRVYDAIAEARRQTVALSSVWTNQKRTREQAHETRNKAFSILRHLAHSIERKGRQHHRRTQHAEVRARQKRPVHKAYDDVVAAGVNDVFFDRMKQSVIVLGRSGRIHAFSNGGKHITSLVLGRGEFERRLGRKRYVLYEPDKVEGFRANVLATLPESDDPAESSE